MKLQELIKKIASQHSLDSFSSEDIEQYVANFAPNLLSKSDTLQEAFGISGHEMEELYQEAYTFYENENYTQATDLFRWLVLLNPFVSKFWMGFGAGQQLLTLFEKALHSYAVAALLDSSSPYPHLYAHDCYYALGDKKEAVKALKLAEVRAQTNVNYFHVKEEIATLKGGV